MNNFAKALQVIGQRWPSIYHTLNQVQPIKPEVIHQPEPSYVIHGIQLTSCYNRQQEAQTQIAQLSPDITKVTIYGPALGDSVSAILQRKHITQVQVVILNRAIFMLAIAQHGQVDWLTDKRVSLVLASDQHYIAHPFIASPSELILAEPSCARLRDKLYLALDNDFIESEHQDNSQVKQTLLSNMLNYQSDRDANQLLSRWTRTNRVYVVAAGPSLEDSIHLLKTAAPDDLIFAVDATLKALDQFGIMPNVVVSIDPNPAICFEGIKFNKYRQCDLVYFPRMKPDLIHKWQGTRYCAYSTSPLYDDVNQKWPRLRLFTGGSVIHPAIDLAVQLGCKEIIMLGADFGFPYPKTHAFWPSNFIVKSPDQAGAHTVENWQGDQITTMPNLRGYLRDLEDYIACYKEVTFCSASPLGAKIAGAKLCQSPS